MDTAGFSSYTTETNKSANCPIGSNFHRDLYVDFASILEDFVSNVKACILHQYSHHEMISQPLETKQYARHRNV